MAVRSTLSKPIYRSQGNQQFRSDERDSQLKRGQSVPYDKNGAPVGGTISWGSIVGTLTNQTDLVAYIASQVPLPKGTVFPGAPANNDLFYRTDRRILYFYDSAVARWLSVDLKSQSLSIADASVTPITVTTPGAYRCGHPWSGLYDIYVLEFSATAYMGAAANWTFDLQKVDGTTFTTIGSAVLATAAAGSTSGRVAVNAIVANTVDVFQGNVTKNSGFGTYPGFDFTYRLIG